MIFISKSHAEQLEGEICCIFSSANCLADRCGLKRSKGAQTGSSRLQRREEEGRKGNGNNLLNCPLSYLFQIWLNKKYVYEPQKLDQSQRQLRLLWFLTRASSKFVSALFKNIILNLQFWVQVMIWVWEVLGQPRVFFRNLLYLNSPFIINKYKFRTCKRSKWCA